MFIAFLRFALAVAAVPAAAYQLVLATPTFGKEGKHGAKQVSMAWDTPAPMDAHLELGVACEA